MIDQRVNVRLPIGYRLTLARASGVPEKEAAAEIDRMVSALRVENARLARELAKAAADNARLRARLAAADGKTDDPIPEYEPQDAQSVPTKKAARKTERRVLPEPWIITALRQAREPMSIEQIMAATGRTRTAVHVACSYARNRIAASGARRARRFALRT